MPSNKINACYKSTYLLSAGNVNINLAA